MASVCHPPMITPPAICSQGLCGPRFGPFGPVSVRPMATPPTSTALSCPPFAFPPMFSDPYKPPVYPYPALPSIPRWASGSPSVYAMAPSTSLLPSAAVLGPSIASPRAPTYIIHPPGSAPLAPALSPQFLSTAIPPATTLPLGFSAVSSIPSSILGASVSLPLTMQFGSPPTFRLPTSPASPSFVASSFPSALPPRALRSPCGPGCSLLLSPRGDVPPATDVMFPCTAPADSTTFGVPQFAQLPVTSPGCGRGPLPLSFSPPCHALRSSCPSPSVTQQRLVGASAPSTPRQPTGMRVGSQSVPGVSLRRCLPGTPVAGASPKFALGRISVKNQEEAEALDAKDGIVDGLYYGTPIVIEGHGRYQPPPSKLGQRVPIPAEK